MGTAPYAEPANLMVNTQRVWGLQYLPSGFYLFGIAMEAMAHGSTW